LPSNTESKTSFTSSRKYIVDIACATGIGDLPVILLEIDAGDGTTIEKTYIYANSQIIAQHDGAPATDNKYFYLHDRLGSVREIIDTDGYVVNTYTYQPFGQELVQECEETVSNPFRFTGQWYDPEISWYYMRARMYAPYNRRFNSRDPVFGKFSEPLTLHPYLYCINEPINRIDPSGLRLRDYTLEETQDIIDRATLLVGTNRIIGPQIAFGILGPGFHGVYDFKHSNRWFGDTFRIASAALPLEGPQFGNYLAGYTTYYNYGMRGEAAARAVGIYYAGGEWIEGESKRPIAEEVGSQYWITKGALDTNIELSDSLWFGIAGLLSGDTHNSFVNSLDRYRLKQMETICWATSFMMDFDLF